MRLLRDRSAPRTLPDHLWEQIMQADRDLKTIDGNRLRVRQLVRRECALPSAERSSAKIVALQRELYNSSRKFNQRKQNLKSKEYLKFRDEWFKSRVSKILASSDESQLQKPTTATEFSPARKAVIEALYPADPSKLSMFSPAKAVVFFVDASLAASFEVPSDRKRRLDPAIPPAKKGRYRDSMNFIDCHPNSPTTQTPRSHSLS
jgi:hypothetical protein